MLLDYLSSSGELVAAFGFLDLNSIIIILDPEEKLYDAMIDIAGRRMDKEGLAELLRELPPS